MRSRVHRLHLNGARSAGRGAAYIQGPLPSSATGAAPGGSDAPLPVGTTPPPVPEGEKGNKEQTMATTTKTKKKASAKKVTPAKKTPAKKAAPAKKRTSKKAASPPPAPEPTPIPEASSSPAPAATLPDLSTDKAVQEALAEHSCHLIGWGARQVAIVPSTLKGKLAPLGLSDLLPGIPTHEARLRRAFVKPESTFEVKFVRQATDGIPNEWVTFRPERREADYDDTATQVEHRPSMKVEVLQPIAVNNETGELSTPDEKDPIFVAVRKQFKAREGRWSSTQVHSFMHKVVGHFNGVPWLHHGGCYVLPDAPGLASTLDRLKVVIGGIGESYLRVIHLSPHWAREAGVGESASEQLGKDWSGMFLEVERFIAQAVDGDLRHPRAFTAKLEQADILRNRISLFGDILQDKRASLDAANDAMCEATKIILDAGVKVRALQKVKGNPEIDKMVVDALSEAGAAAREQLTKAREAWTPVAKVDEADATKKGR